MTRKNRLLHWMGAKDNDIKHFKNMYPEEYNKCIEVFGGSFAVTRDAIIANTDVKYIVNDVDESLYYVYTHPEEYALVMCDAVKNFNNGTRSCIGKKEFNEYINTTGCNPHIITTMIRAEIIMGLFKVRKNTEFESDIETFKKIEFTNLDYLNVINKHKKDKNAFLFLDPPYLFSDNSKYSQQCDGKDMTDIIVNISQIMKDKTTKCKMMLIINDLKIIRHIFGDLVKNSYDKMYNVSKRKDKHLIICNY